MSEILLAKGSSGGRSSSSSRSSPSSKSSSSKPSTPPKGSSSAKPGSSVKTKDGKTVKSSEKKPSNSKYQNSSGVVGDNGYSPRFNNGYTAPAGSVVYYPQHSALDYLPWIYLFSQSSPANDQVTVVQPDNKEVVTKPEPGGIDGLAVFNWIILIVMALAVIGGIVWGINKLTNK